MTMSPSPRRPLAPFDRDAPIQKVRLAEDAGNTRAPARLPTHHTWERVWRDRGVSLRPGGNCSVPGAEVSPGAGLPTHERASEMEVCTRVSLIWTIALCFALISLKSPAWSQTGSELTPKPATAATRAYLDRVAASLPFAYREDFDLVNPGFIAGVPGNRTVDAHGQVLRDLAVAAFFSQAAPSTVNASLWRNAGPGAKSTLFKLSDRISLL